MLYHKKSLFKRVTTLCLLVISTHLLIANVVINNGLTHIHMVEDGQIIKGKIEVLNTDNKPQAIKIYQRDYHFDYKGEVKYDSPSSNDRSNANWIDFSPSFLEIPANGETVVLYEIKVPEGADLNGTYWSILMVEGTSISEVEKNKNSLTINTVIRYAIQIVTNIGETGERNLEFVDAKFNRVEGHKVGEIALENTGERLLQPEISVELFDEEGTSRGVVKAEKKKLYPGTSTKFILNLEGIPEGTYQAVVLADCEEEDIFGVNLKLKISDD